MTSLEIILIAALVGLAVFFIAYRKRAIAAFNQMKDERSLEQRRADGARADCREWREKLRDAQLQLGSLSEKRALAWPKPAHRMPERDVVGEFEVPIDEPWFVAVHQELDDAIADALDEVTQAPSAALTAERRTHIAGGAEFLREFQKRLLELQHKAAHTDDDLAEDEKKNN